MTSALFEAVPYSVGKLLIIRIPKDISISFSSRSLVMAEGTINGRDYHLPLEPDGLGSHWLAVPAELSVRPGTTAQVSIRESGKWIEPDVPTDILTALRADPLLLPTWETLTVRSRWEWIRWIASTRNDATRKKRILVMLDKLCNGDRRPCCFNRNICTVAEVAHNGVLVTT